MSNEAVLLSESIDNLFFVNLPTEILANTPSDTSKNATFPSSQPAFEVRELHLGPDNSLGLSEDAHNTSTSFAFGLDALQLTCDTVYDEMDKRILDDDGSSLT